MTHRQLYPPGETGPGPGRHRFPGQRRPGAPLPLFRPGPPRPGPPRGGDPQPRKSGGLPPGGGGAGRPPAPCSTSWVPGTSWASPWRWGRASSAPGRTLPCWSTPWPPSYGTPPAPQGLDLCAGSGAVGLGLCSLLPQAHVTAPGALPPGPPLPGGKHRRLPPQYQVTLHRGDVLSPDTASRFPPAQPGFPGLQPPPTSPGRSCPPSSPRCRKSPPWPWTAVRTASGSTGPSPGCGCPSSSPAPPSPWRSARPRPQQVCALFRAHGATALRVHQDLSGPGPLHHRPRVRDRTGQENPSTKGVPGF